MDSAEASREIDPLKKALTHCLAIWAIGAPLWVLVMSAFGGRFALDFRHAYLPAAHAVLHGASPYGAVGGSTDVFVYPPLTAYLLAPFTALPTVAAEIIAVALVAAAVPATLLLLGVRDWRCHAIVFLWWPTIIAIQSANVTLPLLVVAAVVWRYRDRRWVVAALANGLLIAVKVLFWPLLLWLVATRRYRTAALAAASSALLVVLPWAGIRFAGFHGYPHLLSSVSRVHGPRSYSVAALLHSVLPSWTTATVVETAIGVPVLVLLLVVGRRFRDRDAFALAILATLVLSPLLEMNYFAILLIVIGLYRQRLGVVWAAPLLIWGAPTNVSSPAQIFHVLAVVALTYALTVGGWRPWLPLIERRGEVSRAGGVAGPASP